MVDANTPATTDPYNLVYCTSNYPITTGGCTRPAPPAPPPNPPPPIMRCSSLGDPHLTTFDNTWCDTHGTGALPLAMYDDPSGGRFEVQRSASEPIEPRGPMSKESGHAVTAAAACSRHASSAVRARSQLPLPGQLGLRRERQRGRGLPYAERHCRAGARPHVALSTAHALTLSPLHDVHSSH